MNAGLDVGSGVCRSYGVIRVCMERDSASSIGVQDRFATKVCTSTCKSAGNGDGVCMTKYALQSCVLLFSSLIESSIKLRNHTVHYGW
jgi:hypothetical protein